MGVTIHLVNRPSL